MGAISNAYGMITGIADKLIPQGGAQGAPMPPPASPTAPQQSMAYPTGEAAFNPMPPSGALALGGPSGMAATGPMSMPNSGSAYGGTEIQ